MRVPAAPADAAAGSPRRRSSHASWRYGCLAPAPLTEAEAWLAAGGWSARSALEVALQNTTGASV
jgi:hypothetical protein